MWDQTMFVPKTSDAELIALVRQTQQGSAERGKLNDADLLLLDFAKELLKQRLSLRVRFARVIELSPRR